MVEWTWGSRVKVLFKWGDELLDENIHPDRSRQSEFSHIYAEPKTYYSEVIIRNYIRDCSEQSLKILEDNSTLLVNVLIPINGFEVSPTLTSVERLTDLRMDVSFWTGTWINLTIDWNDTTIETIYIELIKPGFSNVCSNLISFFGSKITNFN